MSNQSLRQNALNDLNRFGGSVLGRLCPHILLSFHSCLVVPTGLLGGRLCIVRKDHRAISPAGLLAHQKHTGGSA